MSEEAKIELPEPVEGVDYYTGELELHTVSIRVEVNAIRGRESNADIRLKAIDGLKTGKLDATTEIVYTKKIKDVKLCGEAGVPFNLAEWQKAKYAKMGMNEDVEPLKPHEKERPRNESTLASLFGR